MIGKEDVVSFYQYFYRKRYNSKSYKFSITKDPKKNQLCETFVQIFNKRFEESGGKDLLWTYFVFQYMRWEGAVLTDKGFGRSDRLLPNMIIGKTAFKAFIDRDQKEDWRIPNNKVVTKYGFYKEELQKRDINWFVEAAVDWFQSILDVKVHKDPVKAAFLNTEKGWEMCYEETSLYDSKDTACMNCIFKDKCKQVLKDNYPVIYEQRYGRR